MSDIVGWIGRIDAVGTRLAAAASPRPGLTEPDPGTGEQWEAGQVWGHLSEFIQFWIEQVGDVIDQYEGEPIPFGRLRTDSARLTAIETGRVVPVGTLWEAVRSDLGDLRAFLQALPERWSEAVGLHPRLGEMSSERIVEEHLVSHLEEHAAQLEGLAKS